MSLKLISIDNRNLIGYAINVDFRDILGDYVQAVVLLLPLLLAVSQF
jgi:hypothetical protein